MTKRRLFPFLLALAAALLAFAGCGKTKVAPAPPPSAPAKSVPASTPVSTEKPITPEKNPPGDIPDTQVFITYESITGGYALEVPEGWARSVHGSDVKFTDKFDGVQVTLSKSATSPTLSSVQREQVPALQHQGRAVKIQGVKTKAMPHGNSAICVVYTSNSNPDPVTGKQVRLDNVTYYYYHQGTLAALTVWAPSGADNVDQWKRISESFRWM